MRPSRDDPPVSKLMVMANRNDAKSKLKLTAELAPGECIEYDVAAWEQRK